MWDHHTHLSYVPSCFRMAVFKLESCSSDSSRRERGIEEIKWGQNLNGRASSKFGNIPAHLFDSARSSLREAYSSTSWKCSSALLFILNLSIYSLDLSQTDKHQNTSAPLIYTDRLCKANRGLAFCVTVQCWIFPKGSINLCYAASWGTEGPGFRVDKWINNKRKH